MDNQKKAIVEKQLDDIVNFLLQSHKELDWIELGYIKTTLSLTLTEGYLLAMNEAKKQVKEIEF